MVAPDPYFKGPNDSGPYRGLTREERANLLAGGVNGLLDRKDVSGFENLDLKKEIDDNHKKHTIRLQF